ncbi:hypothetical protein HK097_005829 [Rhizophlyctis rosea]|uniref:Uncharacterized protein n=1 Tax=Rhizophlyctis rosea TaxID=64517 RepID=A0AAD5X2C2_9FUNG|nr:hypothetical protein HK097_005829 [Rhizophlyctis rosea]
MSERKVLYCQLRAVPADKPSESKNRAGHPFVDAGDNVEGFEIKLGLGGITMEHPVLTKSITRHDDWSEVVCLNCDTSVYFCKGEGSPLQQLFPATETVLVGEKTIFGDSGEHAKSNSKYSPTLKIILYNQTNPTDVAEALPDLQRKFPNVRTSVDSSINTYIALTKSEMEQRISAFRADEQSRFEQSERRAHSDADSLWARVKEISDAGKLEVREVAPEPPVSEPPETPTTPVSSSLAESLGMGNHLAGPASLKASSFLKAGTLHMLGTTPIIRNRRPSLVNGRSFDGETSPSLPRLDTHTEEVGSNGGSVPRVGSVPLAGSSALSAVSVEEKAGEDTVVEQEQSTGGEGVSAGKRVHFAGVSDAPVVKKERKMSSDDDDVFALDLDDSAPQSLKVQLSYDSTSDSEPSEEEDDEAQDAPPIAATDLLSSSVPISIPRSFTTSFRLRSPDRTPHLDDDLPPDENVMEGDTDDEDAFVAPHILSARTYVEDDLLKRYRPTRKLSVAMI